MVHTTISTKVGPFGSLQALDLSGDRIGCRRIRPPKRLGVFARVSDAGEIAPTSPSVAIMRSISGGVDSRPNASGHGEPES